ncbi:phenylacetate-CoA oxygenase subunit PaaC [Shewanella psychropiezotolerans]|uniref:Phenylacetate-CoA oxygenase subunit PaaC n=1 Tax=Shewanella psychropiezotolerans TaxID=2593655 RepID=A0ABX5WWA0_9GAMM|nr:MULTISPECIES: 1,2-phenylacetyl-CoA epoxidase subunit PaaC [Shewanella]MPY22351.1 phenylacetate-CoA oxygenase subunit PaaC [Shewanella sp. YLB-07]QDO83314.1 phenylacetate-CoA oxygenase subunit PaaC [Shewanella psychropiezotolerans]
MNVSAEQQDLIQYAIRLGDDSLILGHRLSEWVSNGPFLEEDIAQGNIALDYIGRARMYYSLAADIHNQCGEMNVKSEDDYAYLRDERQYQNHLINELPRGDFAYTTVRQLIVDLYNVYYLEALKQSSEAQLSAIAHKAAKETSYHSRRSKQWTLRLGDGTAESKLRMQNALDDIWGYTHEMFEQDELEQRLIDRGVAVDCARFKQAWEQDITAIISQSGLKLPEAQWSVRGGREGYHTENLGHILTELQFVHRSIPDARW